MLASPLRDAPAISANRLKSRAATLSLPRIFVGLRRPEKCASREDAARSRASNVASPFGEAAPRNVSVKSGPTACLKRRVGKRQTADRGVALEWNPRRRVRQRPVRGGAERRGDPVDRSFRDADLPGVKCALDLWARQGSVDRRVEIELSDCRCARNRAGVDPETELVVGRLAALEVEPGAGRNEMQASGQRDARIVVEQNVALERRVAGENRADEAGRHALEPRIQVEGQPPRGILPDDHRPRPWPRRPRLPRSRASR